MHQPMDEGAPALALIAADEDDRRAVSCVWKAVQAGAGAGLCFFAPLGVPSNEKRRSALALRLRSEGAAPAVRKRLAAAYFSSLPPSPASGSAGRVALSVVTTSLPFMPRAAWSPTVQRNS